MSIDNDKLEDIENNDITPEELINNYINQIDIKITNASDAITFFKKLDYFLKKQDFEIDQDTIIALINKYNKFNRALELMLEKSGIILMHFLQLYLLFLSFLIQKLFLDLVLL